MGLLVVVITERNTAISTVLSVLVSSQGWIRAVVAAPSAATIIAGKLINDPIPGCCGASGVSGAFGAV